MLSFKSASNLNRLVFLRYHLQKNTYAITSSIPGTGFTKKRDKLGIIEKKVLPVETDAKKLVEFVCGSNIMKEGEDIKLKPDNEYPDWLWSLNVGKPPKLEDLDKNTKEYWFRVKKLAMIKHNKLTKLKKW